MSPNNRNAEICKEIASTVLEFDEILALDKDAAERALDIISRDAYASKGVRLLRKDETLTIEVYVIIKFGTKIPKLAWELQKQIEKAILPMVEEKISDINIHIQGVEI